ncbi:MAG: hypothetical protein AAB937_00245 [Patescibacteria group bacterium]
MNRKVVLVGFAAFMIVIFIYRPWFTGSEIIGGDWPYLFPEMVNTMSRVPSSWQAGYGGGLGGLSPAYFLSTYNFLFAQIAIFTGTSWIAIYKLFWFLCPVVILAVGGWRLLATVLPSSSLWMRAMASLILATNTYVLMVTGGGQMGVFYAVSIFPWVLLSFFRFLRDTRNPWPTTLILGTVFGVQVSLDPRIAYLSAISMVVLYFFEGDGWVKLWRRLRFGAVAGIIGILLNLYWVLPLLMLKENTLDALGSAYTTVSALRFFSFADFSHALSLLHPNWPENLFGKTYFLQPEFLLLPILAFSSLLFVKKFKENTLVIGFAALGLVGAFLSKGANEPLGFVYVWVFEHVPGFVMFRDPTKFYVLIMTSYAVLIPIALFSITQVMKKYLIKFLWIVPIVFICYWIVLIRPAVNGSLGGTFTKREVPTQYIALKKVLQNEQGFFRTLWVPRQSRFAYSSSNQLPIEAQPLLGATDSASLERALQAPTVGGQLDMLSIRYIIVPFDPYGEIFTDDRKYSQTKREDVEKVLDTVPWLSKIQLNDIAMYKTPQSKDHFSLENGTIIDWRKISDDSYEVDVQVSQATKLMVSESYHHGWQANIKGELVEAIKEPFGTMSFALPQEGSYTVVIEFAPRRWYLLGRILSLVTLGAIVLWLFVFRVYAQKKR